MNKFFIALFGALTLGASVLTTYDVGVMEPHVDKKSVRKGSVHGAFIGSGFRGGK